MIDHVSIAVSDMQRSTDFYTSVLAPLGLSLLIPTDRMVGFGKRYPELWLNLRENLAPVPADTGCHICLRAQSDEAIAAFHAEALALGGSDAGAPGPRLAAFTTYFGAFIYDPDGNKIEAVCFPKE